MSGPGATGYWATSWARYNKSLGDLEFVAGTLREQDIQPLALKGPLLAARHYERAFLRKPSINLDIAIREEDMERALAALLRAGYSPGRSIQASRSFSHHIVLFHPAHCRLEIHFRLTNGPMGPPLGEFFDRAATYRLPSGADVFVLQGADEVFHLALHLVHGRFTAFCHAYELRRICAAGPANLVREAAAKAVERHFAGAFALIDAAFRSLWGEPFLPVDFPMPRTWLHDRINENLCRAFCRWSDLDGAHTLRSRLWGRWLDLQVTDRPWDALRQVEMLSRFAWFQSRRRGWRDGEVEYRSPVHRQLQVSLGIDG